jgi:hypothetical protein
MMRGQLLLAAFAIAMVIVPAVAIRLFWRRGKSPWDPS